MEKLFCSTLFVLVIFSSCSSSLRKSVVRRQAELRLCHAIEGFDCECSYIRVKCTIDRKWTSPWKIVANEKGKYPSVELVIDAPYDIDVNASTLEPVKELYRTGGSNLEFRLELRSFTTFHLSSPGILNRVFPDNLSPEYGKHLVSISLFFLSPVVTGLSLSRL